MKAPLYVAAIGMFDGVHCGHRYVLDVLDSEKKRRGLKSLVITFSNHPLSVITPENVPEVLMTADEKKSSLLSCGVDDVLMMTFDSGLRALSGKEFLCRLNREYGVGALVVGFDNHFGHDRLSAALAAEISGETGVEIVCADAFSLNGAIPSSTLIRDAVREGRVAFAAQLAGRAYSVSGRVEPGRRVGRTIGFPTANVASDEAFLPANGVYAVDVVLPDGQSRRGMANIGTRPSFDDGDARTLEVNIFDFAGNLYGERLEVRFLERLRDERAFESVEDLRAALVDDRRMAEKIGS